MKFSVLYLKKDGIPTNKCNDGEFQHICNAHIVRQIIQLMTAAIDISFAVNFFNKNISLLTNRSLYKNMLNNITTACTQEMNAVLL